MPKLLNGSKADSNTGSLDCESGILPLSYRAPLEVFKTASSLRLRGSHLFCSGVTYLIYTTACRVVYAILLYTLY